MRIAEQLIAIKNKLGQWATTRGGSAEVVVNQQHLWEELLVVVNKPRILIWFSGAVPRLMEEPDCRREDRAFSVVVVRGQGFVDPVSGGDQVPFVEQLELIRDEVRSMLGISDENEFPPVHYHGIKTMPSLLPNATANAFMDAMSLEFTTANDIPEITRVAPGTDN